MATLKRETGRTIKILRSDQEQNGISERDNRTIVEAARSMIHASHINIRFWGEAIMCATYVLNRTGTRTLDNKTPFEAWHKVKPSVSHLRIFGCDAYVHVPKALRKKLEPKSRKGLMMGYSETSKAYRIWDIDSRKIVEARDVLFNEDSVTNSASHNEKREAPAEAEWVSLGVIDATEPPLTGVPVAPVAVGAGEAVVGAGEAAVGAWCCTAVET